MILTSGQALDREDRRGPGAGGPERTPIRGPEHRCTASRSLSGVGLQLHWWMGKVFRVPILKLLSRIGTH